MTKTVTIRIRSWSSTSSYEERAARQRERRERRRQALERPAARAEWLLSQIELDAYFAVVDERDNKIAELDR